jgi:hypothetical protein
MPNAVVRIHAWIKKVLQHEQAGRIPTSQQSEGMPRALYQSSRKMVPLRTRRASSGLRFASMRIAFCDQRNTLSPSSSHRKLDTQADPEQLQHMAHQSKLHAVVQKLFNENVQELHELVSWDQIATKLHIGTLYVSNAGDALRTQVQLQPLSARNGTLNAS